MPFRKPLVGPRNTISGPGVLIKGQGKLIKRGTAEQANTLRKLGLSNQSINRIMQRKTQDGIYDLIDQINKISKNIQKNKLTD